MQRLLTWVRRIATAILAIVAAIFTGVVFPVVVHFIQEQPQETTNVALKLLHVVLKFLYDLSEQTWFRAIALLLVGFVAGLLLDGILRKLDGSREHERKELGGKMLDLRVDLEVSRHNLGIDGDASDAMNQCRAQIMSRFTDAKKLGIWTPGQRIFQIPADDAYPMVRDYLTNVGTMLSDGHFREAKQSAKNSKADFGQRHGRLHGRQQKADERGGRSTHQYRHHR